jgi:hypothetical protein
VVLHVQRRKGREERPAFARSRAVHLAAKTRWRIRWSDGPSPSETTVRTQAIAWMNSAESDPAFLAFERSDDDGETWTTIKSKEPS